MEFKVIRTMMPSGLVGEETMFESLEEAFAELERSSAVKSPENTSTSMVVIVVDSDGREYARKEFPV